MFIAYLHMSVGVSPHYSGVCLLFPVTVRLIPVQLGLYTLSISILFLQLFFVIQIIKNTINVEK